MTLLVVDLSSNNRTFDFGLANAQGCRSGYIKVGGDNLSPRYFSPSYAPRVDAAHSVGWSVGSYWITGGHDPDASALFMAAHLEAFGPADYIVLDNESLDDGNPYNDAEAAEWVRAAAADSGHPTSRILHYASKSLMDSHEWPELLATGCMFIIADYNGTPFVNHVPSTIPAERIVGHQYADNGNIGGASPVDLNAFTEAFLTNITTQGEDELSAAEVKTITDFIDQRIAASEDRNRRESRARVYQRHEIPGAPLWLAGPTFVPRAVADDTPTDHDRDILKGDSLLVDPGDFDRPQQISEAAWAVLVQEHDNFRNAIADAVVAKLAAK